MTLLRALRADEQAAIRLFCDVTAVLGALAAIGVIKALGLAAGAA